VIVKSHADALKKKDKKKKVANKAKV